MPSANDILEDIRIQAATLVQIPPAPFLASSVLFPPEGAVTFTVGDRVHVGAQPATWAKLPPAPAEQGRNPLIQTTIWDIDHPANVGKRVEFFRAMSEALATAGGDAWLGTQPDLQKERT